MQKNKIHKRVQRHPAIASFFVAFVFCPLILLTVLPTNLWAQAEVTIRADANGDTIFNGTAQVLRITITTNDEASGPYKILVEPASIIFSGDIGENQSQIKFWNGKIGNNKQPDGNYTLRVEVGERDAAGKLIEATGDTDTIQVTIDTIPPEISISADVKAFSPNRDRVLDRIEVYYSLSENVETSRLEFLTDSGTEFGQADVLTGNRGNHIYRWYGGDGGRTFRVLPDGIYTLRLRITDKAGNETTAQTNKITIDTLPPKIPSGSIKILTTTGETTLITGRFVSQAISGFKVTPNKGESIASPIDFDSSITKLTLKKNGKSETLGTLGNDGTSLTFTLGNILNGASENGLYMLDVSVGDTAGNVVTENLSFVFDNIAPTLTQVATRNGTLREGDGVNKWMNFVEATLKDNLPDGLNLIDSTIRLTGPSGAILGKQTRPASDKIRWVFLNPLLTKDGIYDGEYTIEIIGIDNANNSTGTIQIPFIYDNKAPEITSIVLDADTGTFAALQDTLYYSQPIHQIVATFEDEGIGVELEEPTRIRLSPAKNDDDDIKPIPGRTLRDNDNNSIAYILAEPLTRRDGSQDGTYLINVHVADTLGNAQTRQVQLIYDTQLPTLVSTVPAVNEIVATLSDVQINLNEITSGIDFVQSVFRLIHNGEEIPVKITSNGTGTVTLSVLSPFAVNGSDDGAYIIEITLVDMAGNQSAIARREFFLVSETNPKIRLLRPEATLVNSLTADADGFVAVELVDYIGVGIDFEKSTLVVKAPNGTTVPRNLAHPAVDEEARRLIWQPETVLPPDGAADGEYTITATFVDFNGKKWSENFKFTVDTQFPRIADVHILTKTPTLLEIGKTTVIAEIVSGIRVRFQADDVDINNTTVDFTGPTNAEIPINVSQDGTANIIINFSELSPDSEYTLSVTPQDHIGNRGERPFLYTFELDFGLPQVSSIQINEKIGPLVYVNEGKTNIVAVITDPMGKGLEFDNENSGIVVKTAEETAIPGIITVVPPNQYLWQPLALPADGIYTVTILPVDKAGRQGTAVSRQFVYDTQAPRITAVSPIVLRQSLSVLNALFSQNGSELSFTVEDVGPSELVLAEQQAKLLDTEGNVLAASVTNDGANQLFLTPVEPLATNGSVDGKYTVTVALVDRAGNQHNAEYAFVYDTQAPQVDTVTLLKNASDADKLVLTPASTEVITDFGEGATPEQLSVVITFTEVTTRLDFANTTIQLTGPGDTSIPVQRSEDGTAQITATFVTPQALGDYTLRITPQDIAGNVADAPVDYRFRLDIARPIVSNVRIGGKGGAIVYVNSNVFNITATLGDISGIGLDFGSSGSSISVTNATGDAVAGTTTDNGKEQLIWVPDVLPLDGSGDGKYTVTITPQDKAGREGASAVRQFIFDTQPPEITGTTPFELSQAVSYVTELRQISLTVEDVGPSELVLAEQQAKLLDTEGNVLAASVTNDGANQLFLTPVEPLATNGSVDGKYTVTVALVDRAGNQHNAEYAFVYDTQAPQVDTVTLLKNASDADKLVLTPASTEVITDFGEGATPEQLSVVITFTEVTTRLDFANTTIQLTGPGDTSIPVQRSEDGTAQITATFVTPQALGDYTLRITPQDIAGNVADAPVDYRFRLDIARPIVSNVRIGGKGGAIVYVNSNVFNITATLGDISGIGLDFGSSGSSISVTNATGDAVAGTTTDNGKEQLIWVPDVLPLDGSGDGKYTVTITPQDKAGREGASAVRQFIFDTQPPEITGTTPFELSQAVSYVTELRQISLTVEDVGPSELVLAEQQAKLLDTEGNVLAASVTNDGANQLFLTPVEPLATNGSVDGKYTVTVALVDRAGNQHNAEYAFVYDTQAPQVDTVTLLKNASDADKLVLTPASTEVITDFGEGATPEQLSVVITFTEVTTRLDFANTTIQLTGPGDTSIPVQRSEDGTAQVTATFVTPQVLGDYTLRITPQDIAGNVVDAPVDYRFRLDIARPIVSNVRIDGKGGAIVYVNSNVFNITATLGDISGIGLDFGSSGSSISVTNAAGDAVAGTTTDDGKEQLIWAPDVLPLDGSGDGKYTVTITPQDKAGREGASAVRQFIFDTQPPEITGTTPFELSQAVSYFAELRQISLTVEDVGPAELLLQEQTVILLDADGNQVPTHRSDNEIDKIYLTLVEPLAKDGSIDGEYTVRINLVDKSGNRYDTEHLIVYDTQPPQLVSTSPADGDILADDIAQVQANLSDAGGSQIDFSVTTLNVIAPDDKEITGELSNDGKSTLILTVNPLVADGRYRIRVSAKDTAGNGDDLVYERSFILSRTLPTVVATEPVTAPAEDAFTNEAIEQIQVELETDDERHLSTVRLLGPGAKIIAGEQQREASRLTYTLARPLAQDGSEDGIYTIEFIPISASGRAGKTQNLTFTYDTKAPELEAEDIQLVVAEPGVNNSLTEIRVTLTDNPSGIDWKDFNEEWIILERVTPNPIKITGKVTDVVPDTLRFQLTVPLADDGSNDGDYRVTVSPKDRAGNDTEPYEKEFTYDLSPPTIDDSTLLLNGNPLLVDLDATDYPTATSATGGVVIQAKMFDTGLGVNLAESTIVVTSPDDSEVPGTTQQNGVDTLVFKSEGLSVRGQYQVTITSRGNDPEFLGFAPMDSITTEFLYETTAPTATVTSDGGNRELTDKAFPLEGTAADPTGTQKSGDGERKVPASGVWLVEIVGTGPDNQPIDAVPATDDSNADEEPWSRWSLDFLPSRSGEYELDVRVTDNAGNYAFYDIGKVTMSVSLTFREPTFGWPNPLRISKGDVAFFSFDVNVPQGETVEITLNIYDWSGNMVLSQTYPDVVSGQRNDQLIKWNLKNQAGNSVARGLYVFRLEAINATGNRANAVGKVLVVN